MNKKIITHILMIAAIVTTTFAAAAFTCANTYAKTSESSAVANIAKVDFESKNLRAESKAIVDNELPLAAAPSHNFSSMDLQWIIVAVAALITLIIIIEDRKIFTSRATRTQRLPR